MSTATNVMLTHKA